MFKIIVLISTFFYLQVSAAVWTDTQTWSETEESKYSNWIKENWSKEFFSRKSLPNGALNPYYGLRVDCADTVYSARVIYAYENQLPFAINDPSGGKKLITNQMNRWDNLKESERIRRFLVYVYNLVSTKSMHRDTYPIAMSKESIIPGSMILTTEKNHHSWVIKNILNTGVPHLVYNSTVGAYSSLVLQERKSWPNGVWVFEGDTSPKGNAGIRYWRALDELKLPVWQVKGYSEDQYKIKAGRWKYELQKILQNSLETNDQKITRLIDNICAEINQRVDAVKEVDAYLKSQEYACLSEADFDTYSTPSRDRRLADEIIYLRNFLKELRAADNEISIDQKLRSKLSVVFPNLTIPILEESKTQKPSSINGQSLCRVSYGTRGQSSVRTIDLAEIKRRLFLNRLSSNPNDLPEKRFGENIKAHHQCKSWGNLNLNYVEQ